MCVSAICSRGRLSCYHSQYKRPYEDDPELRAARASLSIVWNIRNPLRVCFPTSRTLEIAKDCKIQDSSNRMKQKWSLLVGTAGDQGVILGAGLAFWLRKSHNNLGHFSHSLSLSVSLSLSFSPYLNSPYLWVLHLLVIQISFHTAAKDGWI